MIALLGLQRLAQSGEAHPFDFASIRDAVWQDTSWVSGAGDLGLMTWFAAECLPDRLEDVFRNYDFGQVLATSWDGRQARTNALARFLAGIAHARLACRQAPPSLADVAADAYHLLQDNQSEAGIFGQAAFPGFLRQTFCGRFGTLADQMNAIYALTLFARAFQVEEPLEIALRCADSVRALQGEKGQWWFLYDKHTCRVVNRYPVSSVNQDGIAPISLLALAEATGQRYWGSIERGLSWIAGSNELSDDLRNQEHGLIWDAIEPKRRMANYREAALRLANFSNGRPVERLRVRYEARPEHFGWLLYAFGGLGLPRGTTRPHIATERQRVD